MKPSTVLTASLALGLASARPTLGSGHPMSDEGILAHDGIDTKLLEEASGPDASQIHHNGHNADPNHPNAVSVIKKNDPKTVMEHSDSCTIM